MVDIEEKGEDQVSEKAKPSLRTTRCAGLCQRKKKTKGRMEIFCVEIYAPALFKKKKTIFAFLFLNMCLLSVFLSYAVQLKPSDKDFKAQSFPGDTNL